MAMPGFTAENSLYERRRDYAVSKRRAQSPANSVIPARPACANCPDILDNCYSNGWQPRAVCNACATGWCYEGPN